MKEKKNEHYVPQCYLRAFKAGDSNLINVFDKVKMETRENQPIKNVACERYFYDVNFEKLYDKLDIIQKTKFNNEFKHVDLKSLSNVQYLENFLANEIENNFSNLLEKIINKNPKSNKWVYQNCYAISENEKNRMSFYLAIQFIRTKKFRDSVSEMQKN